MKYGIAVAAMLGLAGLAGLGGLAEAQTTVPMPADQIIASRKAGQDLVLAIAADLKRAVEGKVTDVKIYKLDGAGLAAWMKVFPTQFPAGTETGNTKALPTIWSDRAGFQQISAKLVAAGEDIAKAAEANDAAAFATAAQAAGATCGECHKTYRAR